MDDVAAPTLRTRAYAKINLGLEILGKRPDGYHEIVTLAQTISLHDNLTCASADRLEVVAEPPVVGEHENIAGVAARALAAQLGCEPRVRLTVRKRIPLAAGLGGGSSDAAATLRLLAKLWGMDGGRSATKDGLLRSVAASVGSDVPLFLLGGAVLVRRRGELVEPASLRGTAWVALACPRFDVPQKTGALYAALTPDDWTDGTATLAAPARSAGASAQSFAGAWFPNAFDRAAAAIYPEFGALRSQLERAAAAPLSLSGAGPSLYALFDTRSAAVAAARRMEQVGVQTFVARTISGRSPIRAV